jgi:hypothetical protein
VSGGDGGPGAGDLTPEQLHELFVQHTASLLGLVVPAATHEQMARAVMFETARQEGFTPVLKDVADEAARTSHPIWGFTLKAKQTGKEVARIEVPKLLDMQDKAYLTNISLWISVYSLATNPVVRACWTAIGIEIEFFQTKPQSKLKLV